MPQRRGVGVLNDTATIAFAAFLPNTIRRADASKIRYPAYTPVSSGFNSTTLPTDPQNGHSSDMGLPGGSERSSHL